MNLFWALIMGAAQGLTEFFPVSSSAHLSLMPYLFKFTDPGLAFDIALHAGTFLAICFAFWGDWWKLAEGLINKNHPEEKKLIGFLLITTIPGAIFGFLFEDKVATVFRAPLLTAFMLVIFGIILWLVDSKAPTKFNFEKMNFKSASLIGLSQAVALIPGVSRSGATITAGRALGFEREAAVKYSFMAALPITAGAVVFGLKDVSMSSLFSSIWIGGFLLSMITSFWAIKFLTKYVKNHNLNIFLYYRLILAALVILTFLIRR